MLQLQDEPQRIVAQRLRSALTYLDSVKSSAKIYHIQTYSSKLRLATKPLAVRAARMQLATRPPILTLSDNDNDNDNDNATTTTTTTAAAAATTTTTTTTNNNNSNNCINNDNDNINNIELGVGRGSTAGSHRSRLVGPAREQLARSRQEIVLCP